jgi:diguanylate cyclase (GGDEF)-like protein
MPLSAELRHGQVVVLATAADGDALVELVQKARFDVVPAATLPAFARALADVPVPVGVVPYEAVARGLPERLHEVRQVVPNARMIALHDPASERLRVGQRLWVRGLLDELIPRSTPVTELRRVLTQAFADSVNSAGGSGPAELPWRGLHRALSGAGSVDGVLHALELHLIGLLDCWVFEVLLVDRGRLHVFWQRPARLDLGRAAASAACAAVGAFAPAPIDPQSLEVLEHSPSLGAGDAEADLDDDLALDDPAALAFDTAVFTREKTSPPSTILARPMVVNGELVGAVAAVVPEADVTSAPGRLDLIVTHLGAALAQAIQLEWAEQRALRDPLTGALSRRTLDGLLDAEWQRAERYGLPLSLAVLDLDEFKAINDTHGHQAGDLALLRVVEFVRAHLRDCDQLVRWGGDEFVVVLPHTDPADAALVIERIRHELHRRTVEEPPILRLSAGVAGVPIHTAASPAALLALADGALRAAKRGGRGAVGMALGRSGAAPCAPRKCASAALLTGDVRLGERAARALFAAGFEVHGVTPRRPLAAHELAHAGVVVTSSNHLAEVRRALERHAQPPPPLVVLSQFESRTAAIQAIARHHLAHVVDEGERLFSTLGKLSLVDPTGLGRHLQSGARVVSATVRDAQDKHAAIAAVRAAAAGVHCHPTVVTKLGTTLGAMLDGALPDAVPGRESARAVLQWATDARHLAVSVGDPAGRLRPSEVHVGLLRAVGRELEGAPPAPAVDPLGLGAMLRTFDEVYVNISPGVLSEVVGIVDLEPDLAERERRPPSFGVFAPAETRRDPARPTARMA